MREIKFEYVARNKKTGDICREVYTLDQIVSGREILTFFSPDNKNCEMLARRQYTGLKDKNGIKEIYEGDIVRFKAGDTLVWVVRHGWSDDGEYGWHWEFEGKPRSAIREVDRIKERCEVIGNIYENPELLEAKP